MAPPSQELEPPINPERFRRLQPFCYLHDCSGCFRLERLPGGACTHWKAPPCHGAHVKRSFRIALREHFRGKKKQPAASETSGYLERMVYGMARCGNGRTIVKLLDFSTHRRGPSAQRVMP